jgi:DNA modification methylase
MSLISQETHDYSERDLSSFIKNRELPRHRWLEFKEGFSAELVQVAISEANIKRPRILDPFSGSGTTVVEAARLGSKATAIEVNPFLFDVTSAKCHPSMEDTSKLSMWRDQILKGSCKEERSSLEGQSTFTEDAGVDKWIFNTSVLRGYTALSTAIQGLDTSWKTAMKVASLSALMDSSNVRRDGKCVRYKKDWMQAGLSSRDFRNAFGIISQRIIDDLGADRLDGSLPTLIRGDAKIELRKLKSNSHDLVVTSPPYLNSFDYSDVYRPELFAGGYVESNLDLRSIRLKTLRSHVQVERQFASTASSTLLEPILSELSGKKLWSKRIPGMIASYFWDMKSILKELQRIVRPGGSSWLVVSTSAYGGVQIPVDLILADLGEQCGWALRGVYVLRRLRSAGQHWAHLEDNKKLPLRESVIVFDKPLVG